MRVLNTLSVTSRGDGRQPITKLDTTVLRRVVVSRQVLRDVTLQWVLGLKRCVSKGTTRRTGF